MITFDELEEIKKTTQGVTDSLKELENSVKESTSFESITTPTEPTTIATPTPSSVVVETKKEENA
ncbi:MAG: hypothetical protein LRY68_01110 [Sulfurospirillum sp.]|nr:hypothetical protein [Sulfurospirillum sp.]